uniref:Uncharacterized protein n=1 Tax=Desertifilum tharense IPPAS B-1220 TaxID=1781255 RepID=A0ACD5GZD6_9CYAN
MGVGEEEGVGRWGVEEGVGSWGRRGWGDGEVGGWGEKGVRSCSRYLLSTPLLGVLKQQHFTHCFAEASATALLNPLSTQHFTPSTT